MSKKPERPGLIWLLRRLLVSSLLPLIVIYVITGSFRLALVATAVIIGLGITVALIFEAVHTLRNKGK